MKNKHIIKAILDTEVEDLLKHTNQFEQLLNEELKCENCGKIISVENIGVMIPCKRNNKIYISFYCDDVECIKKYNHKNGK